MGLARAVSMVGNAEKARMVRVVLNFIDVMMAKQEAGLVDEAMVSCLITQSNKQGLGSLYTTSCANLITHHFLSLVLLTCLYEVNKIEVDYKAGTKDEATIRDDGAA